MTHIGLYIYAIGCMIAFVMGIYEVIKCECDKNKDYEPEYGYLCAYVLCSWLTVILVVFNYCIDKNKEK